MEIERSSIATARALIEDRLNAEEMQHEADDADRMVRMAEFKAQLATNRLPNDSDLESMPPGWFSGVR